jgi:hypothetical protein
MSIADRSHSDDSLRLNRRSFLKRAGWGGVEAAALVGARGRPSFELTVRPT